MILALSVGLGGKVVRHSGFAAPSRFLLASLFWCIVFSWQVDCGRDLLKSTHTHIKWVQSAGQIQKTKLCANTKELEITTLFLEGTLFFFHAISFPLKKKKWI